MLISEDWFHLLLEIPLLLNFSEIMSFHWIKNLKLYN